MCCSAPLLLPQCSIASSLKAQLEYIQCIAIIISMHEVNLRTLDLNLLVILQALLEERQVTRAAERLDMSQPAVSRALARLRKTFDDPLLVKSAQGFDLSTRAESLKPRLNALLKGFAELVAPSEFDPKTATDRVRIACLDMEGALFLPELLKTMRTEA